jgi:hypothetical protein
MKTKKFFIAIILLSMITGFTSCGTENSTDEITFNYVLNAARERRENIIQPDIDVLTALAYGRANQTVDLTPLLEPFEGTERVSAAQAKYDVKLFFDILQQVYGAYTFRAYGAGLLDRRANWEFSAQCTFSRNQQQPFHNSLPVI